MRSIEIGNSRLLAALSAGGRAATAVCGRMTRCRLMVLSSWMMTLPSGWVMQFVHVQLIGQAELELSLPSDFQPRNGAPPLR